MKKLATLDFGTLVTAILQVQDQFAAQANKAVNVNLTLRNWVIGFYIREYEQNGADRAKYGSVLFDRLSHELQTPGILQYHPRELRRCREFYCAYPEIWRTLSPQFDDLLSSHTRKPPIPASAPTPTIAIRGTPSPELAIAAEKLVSSLTYSHFVELIPIADPLKRLFYEVECIRGNWSVRTLQRQIASLYFERSGLSTDKEKLAVMVHALAEQAEPRLAIRDPYIFEFLGLKSRETVSESAVEDALLDNLQAFLLELGTGFCFEARQKSIIIGNTRGFVDLVFYHRILRCHVLVELKNDKFTHEYIGQLNTYVTWYRRHMMADGDNPPVGLLLCTGKDHALAEYALAGMDNQLFVSKYQLELPKKEDIQNFLAQRLEEVGDGT